MPKKKKAPEPTKLIQEEQYVAEVGQMKDKYDQFESEMIEAYEKGELISTNPSKAEIEKFGSARKD